MEKQIISYSELIPKSLKIALIVGMSSGILITLVLAEVRNNQDIVYVEGPSLTLLTDNSDYKKGEPVTIQIINSGSEPIYFSDTSYGLRITGLAGMLIFSPWISAEEINPVLEPKSEHQLVWNQQKNNGEPVFDGIYKISVHGYDSDGNKIEQTETIDVIEIDLTFGS